MDECAPVGHRVGGTGCRAAAKDWMFTVTALVLLAVVAVQTYRQGHLDFFRPAAGISAADTPVADVSAADAGGSLLVGPR